MMVAARNVAPCVSMFLPRNSSVDQVERVAWMVGEMYSITLQITLLILLISSPTCKYTVAYDTFPFHSIDPLLYVVHQS